MTRALPLKQKQVTALCKGAEKAGFVPVVEINGVVIRLIPANQTFPQGVLAVDEEEDIRL